MAGRKGIQELGSILNCVGKVDRTGKQHDETGQVYAQARYPTREIIVIHARGVFAVFFDLPRAFAAPRALP